MDPVRVPTRDEQPEPAATTAESAEPPKASARQSGISTLGRFGRVVGSSPQMRRLFPLCSRLAQSDLPVIIEGETGTGKEVLAQSLHEASPRVGRPLVLFDCTTVA